MTKEPEQELAKIENLIAHYMEVSDELDTLEPQLAANVRYHQDHLLQDLDREAQQLTLRTIRKGLSDIPRLMALAAEGDDDDDTGEYENPF